MSIGDNYTVVNTHKLIRLVKMTMKTTNNQVKISFNLLLEKIIHEAGLRREGTINTNTYQFYFIYSNDIVFLARNQEQLRRTMTRLIEVAK